MTLIVAHKTSPSFPWRAEPTLEPGVIVMPLILLVAFFRTRRLEFISGKACMLIEFDGYDFFILC